MKNLNSPPGQMEPVLALELLQELYADNIIVHEWTADGDASTEQNTYFKL